MTLRMILTGNLGERHRYLNSLVLDAHQQNVPLNSIPEESAIERLVKIDLASKQRNVDYILHTLKNDDMLYVSRALKSLWLFESEHSSIINPSFLEHELFPHMRLQAVNKMRHWIHTHLRDPHRCSEFYLFYKESDFNTAAKFLWHCSNEYISSEITNILDKITPKQLKILSEKVPRVTQIYYENLKHNDTVLKYYLDNDLKFFTNAKFLLKSDPEVFFFVIENFFVNEKFSSLSSEISKLIIKHHKNRFMSKPELYAAWFLNMKTLAKCLNSEEVKELVIKLAKAEFLESWFTYKRVEPLIKSLNIEERTAFKKVVFVDKVFGPTVKEWPYPIPVPPELKFPQTSLFEDREIGPPRDIRECMTLCSARGKFANFKTLLDKLFDQYRFTSFQQTLFELRKRLRAENSPQTRQYMLLVLVSKTGGRAEHLATLINLLTQYKNEPVHIRAAILRSLVKRAFVWRLAPEQWDKLLEWGHGLGLDGSPPEPSEHSEYPQTDVRGMILKSMGTPNIAKLVNHEVALVGNRSESAEAACDEGLHAVILRDLLANTRPKDGVWRAFLDKFSPLAEYSLSSDERNCIRTRLPAWLLAEAQSRPEVALNRLNFLLDTLSVYHTRFDEYPGTVEAIMTTAKSDFEPAKGLLNRLYKAGVGRKMLIKEFFEMIQTDASYVNALRHDTSILENTERFEELTKKKQLKHERFLRKLALFFTEKDGLSERYRATLELQAATTPNKILARPLALLTGSDFVTLLTAFDAAPPKTPQRQLASALRSNAHVVRPLFDLESFKWRKAGAKSVANRVATCRQKDVERYLPEALSWSRTLRLALMLAKRANKEHEAYEVLASKRPGAALKAALKYFKRQGDKIDTRIWHTVKHYIAKYDQRRCHYSITKIEFIPKAIKPEYCILVYRAYKMSSKETALSILYKIAAMLNEVDDQFLLEDIEGYLRDECTEKVVVRETCHNRSCLYLYVTMIGHYLLLSTSEKVFEERFQRIGSLFFKRVESLWKRRYEDTSSVDTVEFYLLQTFIWSLKYNKAFFDTKYVSCLTLFERVIDWMHSFLTIEKWFEKYVEVHLLMIYLKSVRYCLKQRSEICSEEGVYMLGNVFGKFIVNEVEDLTKKYFPSVIGFYEKKLSDFLAPYYFRCRKFDHSIENFSKALLKGLLSASESVPAYILANSIYKGFRKGKYDDIDEIVRSFQKSENKEIRFRARVEGLPY